MNFQEIGRKFEELAKKASDEEKFLTEFVRGKVSRAAEEHPYDMPIKTAAHIFKKIASEKLLITRKEVKDLYKGLYQHGSSLGDVLASELGGDRDEAIVSKAKYYNRDGETEPSGVIEKERALSNQIIFNALSSAFEGSGELRIYSEVAAERAKKVCLAKLTLASLEPKSIDILTGNESFILCRANYETPRGMASVIIPTEIVGDKAMFPSMFLGQDSFVDFKADLIRNHIVSTAGLSFKIDSKKVLAALSTAKNGIKKICSDVEMAAVRVMSDKYSTGSNDPNSILGISLDEPGNIIEDPEFEKGEEHFEFSKRVTSPAGAASFLFGDRAVNAGRDVIFRKMAQFGYPNVRVKVLECSGNEIRYAVGIGTSIGMMVPITVSERKEIIPPKIAIASGEIKDFSKEGVDYLVKSAAPDVKMLSASSYSAGLRPSELIQQVKDSVYNGNYSRAEDAINVLATMDPVAHKVAVSIMLEGLSGRGTESFDKVASINKENSSSTIVRFSDGTEVRDTPVFNSYNIFFPTE